MLTPCARVQNRGVWSNFVIRVENRLDGLLQMRAILRFVFCQGIPSRWVTFSGTDSNVQIG